MGYSMSVPCKSLKARDSMFAFLQEHHRSFTTILVESPEVQAWTGYSAERLRSKLQDEKLWDPTSCFVLGPDLSYGRSPSKIGFNFNNSTMYRVWMWTILRWMALRVGRKTGLNALSGVGLAHELVPYLTYDDDPHPVILEGSLTCEGEGPSWMRTFGQYLVDPYGIPIHPYPDKGYMKVCRLISPVEAIMSGWADVVLMPVLEHELIRLDALWEARE